MLKPSWKMPSRSSLRKTMKVISSLVARIRESGPYPWRATHLGSNPAVPQPFNAAQMKLVLQLDEIHHGDQTQAALLLESCTLAGVFSEAQRSMISNLLSLERDDLMLTLIDCASTAEARCVVGEELLREKLSHL